MIANFKSGNGGDQNSKIELILFMESPKNYFGIDINSVEMNRTKDIPIVENIPVLK